MPRAAGRPLPFLLRIEVAINTKAVIMKGNAWYNCVGILASQPKAPGKAAARLLPETRKVLKKPNTKVPKIAIAGLQFAKITKATAIQPYPLIQQLELKEPDIFRPI